MDPHTPYHSPALQTSPTLRVVGYHFPRGFIGPQSTIYSYPVDSRRGYDTAVGLAKRRHPRDEVKAARLAFDLLAPETSQQGLNKVSTSLTETHSQFTHISK